MVWISGNRRERGPSKGNWAKDFARNNPLLVAWNGILLCGGTIMLLYHLSIQFLPDFSSADLAGLLASVTVTGLLLLGAFTIILLTPVLILRFALNEATPVFDSTKLSRAALLLTPIVCWALIRGLPALLPEEISAIEQDYYMGVTALLGAGLLVISFLTSRQNDRSRQRWTIHLGLLSLHFVMLVIWAAAFLLPLATIELVASETGASGHFVLLVAALIFTMNAAAYYIKKEQWWQPVVVAAVLLLVLPIIVGSRPLLWATWTVETLAYGNRHAHELTISSRQCRSFASFGLPCSRTLDSGEGLTLRNVNVLSRVGTSVLLEILIDNADIPDPMVVLPDYNGISDAITLRSASFRGNCRGGGRSSNAEACSQCDTQVLMESKVSPRGPAAQSVAAEPSYSERLACLHIAIPKADLVSLILGRSRQYAGFSSVVIPARP